MTTLIGIRGEWLWRNFNSEKVLILTRFSLLLWS